MPGLVLLGGPCSACLFATLFPALAAPHLPPHHRPTHPTCLYFPPCTQLHMALPLHTLCAFILHDFCIVATFTCLRYTHSGVPFTPLPRCYLVTHHLHTRRQTPPAILSFRRYDCDTHCSCIATNHFWLAYYIITPFTALHTPPHRRLLRGTYTVTPRTLNARYATRTNIALRGCLPSHCTGGRRDGVDVDRSGALDIDFFFATAVDNLDPFTA